MNPMGRTCKAIAILALAAAMLNASPGLCFCRHAVPDSHSDNADEQGCCHRSSPTISGNGFSCCQIDRAERQATAQDSVVVFAVTPVAPLPIAVLRAVATHDLPGLVIPFASSPPVRTLRV